MGAAVHDDASIVLLHGIGSNAQSWNAQLNMAEQAGLNALAWNAPGYGKSVALEEQAPSAASYAKALWQWLDALSLTKRVRLVGHSLGALMAAAATTLQPKRVEELILLSPALGYGDDEEATRNKVVEQRLTQLQNLSVEGLAKTRASAMLAAGASHDKLAQVERNMSALNVAGYTQAIQMLAQGRLLHDISRIRSLAPNLIIRVAVGKVDTITPPEKCALAAKAAGTALKNLNGSGHACAIDAPAAVFNFISKNQVNTIGVQHD